MSYSALRGTACAVPGPEPRRTDAGGRATVNHNGVRFGSASRRENAAISRTRVRPALPLVFKAQFDQPSPTRYAAAELPRLAVLA